MIAGNRVRQLLWIGASNTLALAASMLSLLATVRLMAPSAFSEFATVLAVQALCFVVPAAVTPGCARILASANPDPRMCLRIRMRAGGAGALLLLAAGAALQAGSIVQMAAAVWLVLAFQLPLAALEAHHLQVLQMENRFAHHSLAQPLSRLLRMLGLWTALGMGAQGPAWVAAIQTASQAAPALLLPLLFPATARRPGGPPFSWTDAGWNAFSGSVVWGSTRANLLVSKLRMDPAQTASYGLADNLASSLLVVLQSIMTLVQPGIYRWRREDGFRPLLRKAALVGSAGSAIAIAASLLATPVLDLALDDAWAGSGEAFSRLCLGGVCQSWVAVAAAILHRLGATRTILALEFLGGSAMIACTVSLDSGASARDAALCWSVGRAVWAVGGCAMAALLVRRSLRPVA